MKQPRLRQDIQPDLSKDKHLNCSRCKCQVFDEKFFVYETSALAPVDPGMIKKFSIMVCTCCNTILTLGKEHPGEETIQ